MLTRYLIRSTDWCGEELAPPQRLTNRFFPFIPAYAGIQFFAYVTLALGPRLCGDERII